MNDRIQELYRQSLENKFDYSGGEGVKPGEYYSNYKTVLNAEKFAELIVLECIEVCNSRVGNSDYNTGRMHCALDLKEHFGVEE